MSYTDHLSDEQFGKYKSAKEQSKGPAKWLATEAGHRWQDKTFIRKTLSEGNNYRSILTQSEYGDRPTTTFFSVKDDENYPGWDWGSPSAQWPAPHMEHDVGDQPRNYLD